MSEITSQEAFKQALASLSIPNQRQVGARFIAHVLDLTENSGVKRAQGIASKADVTAEELSAAYHVVHHVYVETHPRSDLAQLDWSKQAAHFVAEACLVCLAPTYHEARIHHLAEKVAMYCGMARTCASIEHEGQYPNFERSEEMVKQEIQAQYALLSDFLENS